MLGNFYPEKKKKIIFIFENHLSNSKIIYTPSTLGNKLDIALYMLLPSHPPKAVNAKVLNPLLCTPPLFIKNAPTPSFEKGKKFPKNFSKNFGPI
jgi:hypothetical protein